MNFVFYFSRPYIGRVTIPVSCTRVHILEPFFFQGRLVESSATVQYIVPFRFLSTVVEFNVRLDSSDFLLITGIRSLYQYYIRHCLIYVHLMCTTSQKVTLLSSGKRRTSKTSFRSTLHT